MLAAAVAAYLAELARQGRGAHTLRAYRSDLAVLLECSTDGTGAVDDATVARFVARLDAAAPATRSRRLSTLRGFLRWSGWDERRLRELGQAAPKPTARRRTADPSPPEPTPADVAAVLARIPRQADRDQLLFGLLAGLGLRPGEALALRIEDFDEKTERLHVRGWGGASREVLVDDSQLAMRLVNLKRTGGRTRGPLFTAPGRHTPLRYQSVVARWSRYTAAAGVSIRLGDLRRVHARQLLAGGVPEAVVRDRLGQRSGPLTGRGGPVGNADDAIRACRERTATSPTPSRGSEARRTAG